MKEHETLYGEIVFDSVGYAVGAIWLPNVPVKLNHDLIFRAKRFTDEKTDLFESREKAIKFCLEKSR